jgi:hypothetical protein
VIVYCALVPLSAASLTFPNGSAGVEGSTSVSGLFNTAPATFQFVWSSSQLGALTIGDQITGIRFRQDGPGSSASPGSSFTNYTIAVSASANPIGSLSTTFASNVSGTATVVRTGSLTFAPGDFPGGSSPNAFGPLITFTTPHAYTGGDLLFTITHSGGTGFFSADVTFNAALGDIVVASSDTATTGSFGPGIAVIGQLEFDVAVPEPATYAVSAIGLLVIAALRRRG